MRYRLLIVFVSAVALVCAGCSSETDTGATISEPTSASDTSTEASVVASSGGGDFCSAYAARVSQGLVNIRDAEAGNLAVSEEIATSLAAQAPVSQAEMEALAPPEPLGYLQAVAAANAAGASGDLSALDGVTDNLVALNDWAIANCGDEYAPVFEEYRGVIG